MAADTSEITAAFKLPPAIDAMTRDASPRCWRIKMTDDAAGSWPRAEQMRAKS